jgi:saccharopine dehydrogenase (NAD+, L-lysine-forming)
MPGLMALLGSGFDPGVTSVFAMWLKKHKLDHPHARHPRLQRRRSRAGLCHQLQPGNQHPRSDRSGAALGKRRMGRNPGDDHPRVRFRGVGPKNMYLMYHEELESLAQFMPELERGRFWMTFGDAYIKHLTVLQNVGMTRIDPVMYRAEIIPLQFLGRAARARQLGPTTKGKTNIGDIATGEALDGSGEKTFYIYNICDHEDAYDETGNQAVSYTTGVPAMIGAAMMLTGAVEAARACSTSNSSIPIRSWTCSTSTACRGR